MLRRLNVRTRLVAVIAVPLVLLLAVAVPEVLERRGRADDADRAAARHRAGGRRRRRRRRAPGRADLVGGDPSRRRSRRRARRSRSSARSPTTPSTRADAALVSLGAVDPAVATAARGGTAPAGRPRPRCDRDRHRRRPTCRGRTRSHPSSTRCSQVQESVGAVTADLGSATGSPPSPSLGRSKEAAATQDAQMAAASTWGELRGGQTESLTSQRADEAAYRAAYLAASPPGLIAERRSEVLQGAATQTGRVVDEVIDGAPAEPPLELARRRARPASRSSARSRATGPPRPCVAIDAVEASAAQSSTGYLVLAGIGLLLALGLALAAARSITRPLRELTDAADHLARSGCRKLVDALRHPVDDDEHDLAAAIEPIAVRTDDELGHLAQAFNAVQSVAVDVAAEQATAAQEGHQRPVREPRPPQPGAPRPPDPAPRPARARRSRTRRCSSTSTSSTTSPPACAATRRASSSWPAPSPGRAARSRSMWSTWCAPRVSEVEEYERVELGTLAAATLHGPAGERRGPPGGRAARERHPVLAARQRRPRRRRPLTAAATSS